MKKIIVVAFLAILPFVLQAQERKIDKIVAETEIAMAEVSIELPQNEGNENLKIPINNNVDKWAKGRRWAMGVQVGTDIGSAIPVPFKYIPSTFNPFPKLKLSLGARFSWSYNNRWSLHLETTYKEVVMNADARVENQRFKQDGETQYYSGVARMDMSFTMVEFPIYAKFALTKSYNDFIILGAYYAYNLSPEFVTTATNGYIGGKPNMIDGAILPSEPLIMNFSEYLGKHDAGIVIGYEKRIWNRLNIGLRIMMGFNDIFRADAQFFDYKMWQMRGVVNLEYDLFLMR